MSHALPCHQCPRPLCGRPPLAHRPLDTPARTPLRGPAAGLGGARLQGRRAPGGAPLQGHRTPGGVHLLAQRVAEVLVGRRAPEVMRDQATRPVREELRRLRGTVACELAPRLTRVFHQSLPHATVEASAVIRCDHRTRAFAFRARREGGLWVCTSLETDTFGRAR